MRTDTTTTPRGETGRVAARVRALVGESPTAGSGPGYLGRTGSDQGEDDGASGQVSARPRHRPTAWQRLAARIPVRLDPGRRAALAVGVAVLVAGLVTGVWVMSSRPQAIAVSASRSAVPGSSPLVGTDGAPASASTARSSPPVAASPSSSPGTGAVVVVDVAGKVRHPGVYRLPSGARVDDAITAAGGALAGVDLTSLNLAARLVDGQQIAVGRPGAAPSAPGSAPGSAAGAGAGGGSASGASPGAPVDLNTATLDQLETLPGVGPVLGQHILDWRAAHGSFATVDQLNDVTGIGGVKFAALRPLVTV